jgi:hypothetical protein
VKLTSFDKQLLGQVGKIRGFKPEPYKGKVKFVGEVLRRKAGKSVKNKIMSLTKPERRQRIRFRIRKSISGTAN